MVCKTAQHRLPSTAQHRSARSGPRSHRARRAAAVVGRLPGPILAPISVATSSERLRPSRDRQEAQAASPNRPHLPRRRRAYRASRRAPPRRLSISAPINSAPILASTTPPWTPQDMQHPSKSWSLPCEVRAAQRSVNVWRATHQDERPTLPPCSTSCDRVLSSNKAELR